MRSMELDSSTGWLRSVCRLPICSCLLAIVSKKLASSLFMMKLQQQEDARWYSWWRGSWYSWVMIS
jgi:hypothetical protein